MSTPALLSRDVVSSFKSFVNWKDLEGISDLISDNHVMQGVNGSLVVGRTACIKAWTQFFSRFPSFRTHFDRMFVKGDQVIILGHATCADKSMSGTMIWVAEFEDGALKSWSVYRDSLATRLFYGLPS